MTNTKYIGRFVRHGGKFLWRVGGIFAGVAVTALWAGAKQLPLGTPDDDDPLATDMPSDPIEAWNQGIYNDGPSDGWTLDRFGQSR